MIVYIWWTLPQTSPVDSRQWVGEGTVHVELHRPIRGHHFWRESNTRLTMFSATALEDINRCYNHPNSGESLPLRKGGDSLAYS